jgi:hypothetical protein
MQGLVTLEWQHALLLFVFWILNLCFLCYTFSFKGKETNVRIVFRGYVKGNDETP